MLTADEITARLNEIYRDNPAIIDECIVEVNCCLKFWEKIPCNVPLEILIRKIFTRFYQYSFAD